jgi:hypothetical protein
MLTKEAEAEFFTTDAIGKSARKVPYGPMNLQKFAHFYVLSGPAQGDIVGREYMKVCKFLQIHGTIWYFSR